MSEPTFAIVITAYEAADVITGAIDSALAQTRPAEEVIVVDDGSKDDLGAVLASYGERIKLVRKANGGGASARNAGVAATACEFMAILDADDAYHPRRLEATAELARQRPELDLIATDARFVVEGRPSGTFLKHNRFPEDDQRTAIFDSCFPTGWPTVRISALQAAGGFDEEMRIAYDWDCWLRMILAGSRVGMVREPLYDYVLHGGSLASSRVASLRERVRLLEKAARNPELRAEERPALERSLALHREQAARGGIEAALYGDSGRSEAARIARTAGLSPRTRSLAALAALAPPLARRYVSPTAAPEERFEVSPG
ncbi:MAG TPA: glycosyltransferase family A protein [Solirubrobacterales bacterium]|nr:glycosyltransferase family A protein [Solirubrobacterales bacterium]